MNCVKQTLLSLLFLFSAAAAPPLAPANQRLRVHDSFADQVLNGAISGAAFWEGGHVYSYKNEGYDEIRLKPNDNGYVPFITGEGGQHFEPQQVVDVVFNRMDELPRYMSGAKQVQFLGRGFDDKMGFSYVDNYYFVDLTMFYATFPMRTYLVTDGDSRTFLPFEKVRPNMVDASTWAEYEKKMKAVNGSVSRRWPPFNSVIPADKVFGMYIISGGEAYKTRVSLLSWFSFGSDAGWVARWGSQLPSVLKVALKNGFDACVAIAETPKPAVKTESKAP